MKRIHAQLIVMAALAGLVLGGCGGNTAASRFYTLDPVKRPGPQAIPAPAAETVAVSIAQLEIPDYLDRPEIVTRGPGNGLQVADYDRWGGDLRSDIGRVLAETISNRLSANRVIVGTAKRILPSDYRISVSVTRFDAVPGERVWLRAQWAVMGKDGRTVLLRRESDLSEPMQGSDFRAIVAAMSRAVDRLGMEIAEGLRPIVAGSGK
jgi:uncharacterized lipoprotein YmbA